MGMEGEQWLVVVLQGLWAITVGEFAFSWQEY